MSEKKKSKVLIFGAIFFGICFLLIIIGIIKDDDSPEVRQVTSTQALEDKTENAEAPLTDSEAETTSEKVLVTYAITGKELGEYGTIKTFNANGKSPFEAIYYKLPAGEYKVSCNNSTRFSIVRDNIHVYSPDEVPNPDIIDYVENSIKVVFDKPSYISVHGDESILFEQEETLYFSMIAEPAEKLYCIIGNEIGQYGKTVILNADTDMPIEKYLYKIPAGKYKVTTTFKKSASFSIVKDTPINNPENSPYTEELQYVDPPYLMTAGDDGFNGQAKKEIEITIAEDESICITGNNEFLFLAARGD